MKKIYLAHSKGFDYKKELYLPLQKSQLAQKYEFVFPHEYSDDLFNSKDFLKNDCNIIIVEATYPKLGVGIEVGWADAFEVPIVTIYKTGSKLSGSLKQISRECIEYSSPDDMISKLEIILNKL